MVDGKDAGDIAEALLKLLRDPGLANHMGQLGLELARANNTKAVADRFLKMCERLLSTGRAL